MARIVFYCHAKRALLDSVEFYRQDIAALRELGHDVVVCTRWREIPWRFDALYVWWWTHALPPVLLARLLGRPAIVTGVMNFRFPETFAARDYLHRPWYHKVPIFLAARAATVNLFISRFERDPCAKHFGLRDARYCHLTLEDDYLQGPSAERETAILNIAWSGRQNLVRKGVPELLEAVRILRDEGRRDVRLYLAGHRGDGFEGLEARIAELGLGEQVRLLGELSREQKLAYQRRCEIYAQPSHFEGFGLAMAEAMGSGACVVTCDVGAVREVVGDAGLYVAPGSPQDLAAGLRRALDDREGRLRLQHEAVARVRRMFGRGKKLEFLRDLLASLGVS
ncbi:MAG TPA: glycosyltransferase [Candidatus Krumholzibacteria bacterium]|nr:glycosyltransferase [Candidatus Krumholzibacteria bacterium]